MVHDALVRAGRLLQQDEPAASTVTPYTIAAIAALYKQVGYEVTKTDEPVVSASAFQIVRSSATVTGKIHNTGLLEAEPIATIGIGPRGLICNAAGGYVPVEAKEGQQVRIPALDPELRPVNIIQSEAPTVPASGGGNLDVPSASGPPDAETETRALFVAIGDGAAKLSNVVTASLILAQSDPDPLVVPSSALWALDGQPHVTVLDTSGARDVAVVVSFSAGGETVISTAETTFPLAEGDKVVVAGTR